MTAKRRLLFYNDARHFYMFCYDPPMRLEDARAPVDEVAWTGVDTLVYGLGVGSTVFHQTRVGEIWGQRLDQFTHMHEWRASENIASLIERGLDPLEILIERAHAKELEFFASLRLTHGGNPENVDTPDTPQFKIDHPQWCLRGDEADPLRRFHFNWVFPQVRQERFALIEETANHYQVDGLELDCTFSPYFFEADEVRENAPILTEFVRQARGAVDRAAAKRGQKIALGARVLPALSSNLEAGMDVAAWLQQELLDFVVPNIYQHRQVDADAPFEWLLELARPTGCQVYPALQDKVCSEGEKAAGADHYRAAAAAYFQKGADAIYLPGYFPWPIGAEERQVLSEIRDVDILAESAKHYVVPRHHPEAARYGYDTQLPLPLQVGLEAPGQTVRLYAADDPARAGAILKLLLLELTSLDALTVSLNGAVLPAETRRRFSHGYTYSWLEFTLDSRVWHRGYNEVGVALPARPQKLASCQVVLESVELVVNYPRPLAAAL